MIPSWLVQLGKFCNPYRNTSGIETGRVLNNVGMRLTEFEANQSKEAREHAKQCISTGDNALVTSLAAYAGCKPENGLQSRIDSAGYN